MITRDCTSTDPASCNRLTTEPPLTKINRSVVVDILRESRFDAGGQCTSRLKALRRQSGTSGIQPERQDRALQDTETLVAVVKNGTIYAAENAVKRSHFTKRLHDEARASANERRNTREQRGPYGPIIIEPRDPSPVDADDVGGSKLVLGLRTWF